MLILRSCAEICQGTKGSKIEVKKRRSAFKCALFPLSSSEALPNGVNICANSIKWICSYECDLHFVGEITLSHACQGSSCTRIEWQLPQSTHSTEKGGRASSPW